MPNQLAESVQLSIEGMTCSGCVNAVSRALSKVPGVTDVAVDLEPGQARIRGQVDPQTLVAAVEKAGFGARLAPDTKAG